MQITLENSSELTFVGTNERNQSIVLSGNKEGVSPMEAVLMAAAGCSAVDVELLLKKTRQAFTNIKVNVNGLRAIDQVPSVFTQIHLIYIITGTNLKHEKVRKVIEMSVEKYCSVIQMLEKTVNLSWSFEILESLP